MPKNRGNEKVVSNEEERDHDEVLFAEGAESDCSSDSDQIKKFEVVSRQPPTVNSGTQSKFRQQLSSSISYSEIREKSVARAPERGSPAPIAKINSGKRVSEEKEMSRKPSKKAKKKEKMSGTSGRLEKKTEDESSKKQPKPEAEGDSGNRPFQRKWNEEEEIVILLGLLDYFEEKNADPLANLDSFFEFVKGRLHMDATNSQLRDEIHRLEKRYLRNKRKEAKGKELVFSKSHEHVAYQLSKSIWGKEFDSLKKEECVSHRRMAEKGSASGSLADSDTPEIQDWIQIIGMSEMDVRILRPEILGRERYTEFTRGMLNLTLEQMSIHIERLKVKAAMCQLVHDEFKSRLDSVGG